MTDVRTLLARAADPEDVTGDTVAADLARARRGLRRRTALRVAGAAVTGTALVATVTVVRSGAEPGRQALDAPQPSRPTATAPATSLRTVRLVAYTGQQPSGYRVAYVPSGWEVQGANTFRMTIAPVGSPDRHPDSFTGKLVVMLRSSDDTGTPVGTPVAVGGRRGYVNRAEAPLAVLTYQDSAKHWVVVQVPDVLGWSDTEIARFGAGVEVTHDAEQTVG